MIKIEDLIIDEEIQSVIPPLDEEEFNQLKENILNDGEVFHPLITWNGILIDGHHRYKILKEYPEIPFKVSEKTFGNRYEAIAWICQNQLGRRNLSNVQKMALLGKRYNAEKQSHGDSDRFNAESPKRQNVALQENSHLTAKRIGEEMSVSSRTVERAAKFVDGMEAAEEFLPGITKEIISGEIKPTQSDVMAIAKAPTERRKEMAQELRAKKKLTEEEKEARRNKRKLLQSIRALDLTHIPSETNKIKPTDMIDSFRADGEHLIEAMEFYFKEFPEILTEKQYKDLADEVFIRIKTEVEKYLYSNFSNGKVETSTESEVMTDNYNYADFEGTFNATLDLKRQGKGKNILGFFTLEDSKKIVASAWESDNYLGLYDIDVGTKVTLTFKKMKSGNSYLTEIIKNIPISA